MNLENLTKGELFIVKWQYAIGGDFLEALARAITRADLDNLERISKGFPEEIAAYRKFTSEPGWWPALRAKVLGYEQ